jgi:alanyl-tRNA synthetase
MTEDGLIVVSGYSIFKYMETKGLPLDFILSILNKEEYRIDWLEFILTSVEHKWKLPGTMLKIDNSMNDVYGKEFSYPIIKELNKRVEKFLD